MKPKTILADTLYGGDDNSELAKTHNDDLVSLTFKKDNNRGLGSFRFDDHGRVTSCPEGHSPIKVSYKKKTRRYIGRFDLKHCIACPHVANCPVKAGKKNYYFLRYSDKDYRLAVRRRAENSEPFIDGYSRHAGVEATMSQYDALTGVKRLRVRGFKAVRFCATLKAAGLNMLRATMVRKAQSRSQACAKGRFSPFWVPFPFVKERIRGFLAGFNKIVMPKLSDIDWHLGLAA